jgi:hypothetical protein
MALPELTGSRNTRVVAVSLLLLAMLTLLNRNTAFFTAPEAPSTVVIDAMLAEGSIEYDGVDKFTRLSGNDSIAAGASDFGEKDRGFFVFNASRLPKDSTILATNFTITVESPSGDTFCSITPLEGTASDYADNNVENRGFYEDLGNGIPYVRVSDFCTRTGTWTIPLSRGAARDLQRQLSRNGTFGFGVITIEDGAGPQARLSSSRTGRPEFKPRLSVLYAGASSALDLLVLAALAGLGVLAAAVAYGISRARKQQRKAVEAVQPPKPAPAKPPAQPPAKKPAAQERRPEAATRKPEPQPTRAVEKEHLTFGKLSDSLRVLRKYGKTLDSGEDEEEEGQEITIFHGPDDREALAREEMKKADLLLSNLKRTSAASKEIDEVEELLAEARKLLREGDKAKALLKARQATRLLK